MSKPPLGLRPNYIWRESRILEIFDAMTRYAEADHVIPKEWLEELMDLYLQNMKDKQ